MQPSDTPELPPDGSAVQAGGQATGSRSRGRSFAAVHHVARATSTNDLAVRAARAGAPHGTVVVADEQLAGRGRRDRRWLAPPEGALLCSVILRWPLALGEAHLASSIVALSALGAIDRLAPGPVSLKWPNDLVAPSGKLAGVLAELVDGAPPAVVVGIGLNLYWPPTWLASLADEDAALLAGATSLEAATGQRVARDEYLEAFIDELRAWDDALGTTGPATARAAYAERCATLGQDVRVETPGGPLTGRAVDLDERLALVVDTAQGRRVVEAGDVVHLRSLASDAHPDAEGLG